MMNKKTSNKPCRLDYQSAHNRGKAIACVVVIVAVILINVGLALFDPFNTSPQTDTQQTQTTTNITSNSESSNSTSSESTANSTTEQDVTANTNEASTPTSTTIALSDLEKTSKYLPSDMATSLPSAWQTWTATAAPTVNAASATIDTNNINSNNSGETISAEIICHKTDGNSDATYFVSWVASTKTFTFTDPSTLTAKHG